MGTSETNDAADVKAAFDAALDRLIFSNHAGNDARTLGHGIKEMGEPVEFVLDLRDATARRFVICDDAEKEGSINATIARHDRSITEGLVSETSAPVTFLAMGGILAGALVQSLAPGLIGSLAMPPPSGHFRVVVVTEGKIILGSYPFPE